MILLKDILFDCFQDTVSQLLVSQKCILDIMNKLQEFQFRTNRAVIMSVTSCGCVSINAKKQSIPTNISLQELKQLLDYQVQGKLCSHCKEAVERELGSQLFYLAALCNSLDINLYDSVLKEYNKMDTLGIYNMF